MTQLKGLPKLPVSHRNAGLLPVLSNALDASLHLARGNTEQAIASIEKAVVTHESLSVEFGPPSTIKPVHELYGDILLELNRPEEAVTMYRAALDRGTRRALSLLGLARATKETGDIEASTKAYADLKSVWRQADSDIVELQEVANSISRLPR